MKALMILDCAVISSAGCRAFNIAWSARIYSSFAAHSASDCLEDASRRTSLRCPTSASVRRVRASMALPSLAPGMPHQAKRPFIRCNPDDAMPSEEFITGTPRTAYVGPPRLTLPWMLSTASAMPWPPPPPIA